MVVAIWPYISKGFPIAQYAIHKFEKGQEF